MPSKIQKPWKDRDVNYQVRVKAQAAENAARERARATCRVYTSEELAAFAKTMGQPVSASAITEHKEPTRLRRKKAFGVKQMTRQSCFRTGTI